MSERKLETFGTRWGFIAAAIAMAVGTGNIWRFPRVAGENGGGAFLIAWVVALLLWSIPLLMAEMVIGRKTRQGTVGAFRDFLGKKFTWMGAWVGFVALGVMFYYSVVTGWTIKYFTLAVSGVLTSPDMDVAKVEAIWNTFTNTPSQTILFHAIAMLVGGYIIYNGVTKGIERWTKIMIPTLFLVLILIAIRALTLPGAMAGVEYFYTIDWSKLLEANTWLQAFTQSAWSTGAGWFLLMTYAIYTKKKSDVGLNVFVAAFGNNTASLIAAFAVIPAIFALSPSVEYAHTALAAGNNGLTFIYLTNLFSHMPAGQLVASVFFFALAVAAVSSLISMIEVGVSNLINAGMSRQKATKFVVVAGFILGIPSAYSINFLDNQDWAWGVGLLVSGLITSIAIMKYGVEKARQEINHEGSDMYIGVWWSWCIRLFPVMFLFIFGWWTYQSITWYPDNWWHPFETFSTGTMVFQWLVLFVIVYLANNWLADYFNQGKATLDDDDTPVAKGGNHNVSQ